MKKFLPFLVAMAAVAAMVVLPAEAYADWRLYDNFSSGVIDTNRWDVIAPSANISVEGKRVKFFHQPGYPGRSAWLGIKIAPETIKGIKAKVTVESCTGDVRARIGGFIGKWEGDYVFNQLVLEGAALLGGVLSPRIFGGLGVVWPPPYFPNSYSLFYGEFVRPADIIGHTFTITMIFSDEEFTYKVSGLGEIQYELPEALEDLSPTDDHFKGIGTRSALGQGPCVVYFDDVYVLR